MLDHHDFRDFQAWAGLYPCTPAHRANLRGAHTVFGKNRKISCLLHTNKRLPAKPRERSCVHPLFPATSGRFRRSPVDFLPGWQPARAQTYYLNPTSGSNAVTSRTSSHIQTKFGCQRGVKDRAETSVNMVADLEETTMGGSKMIHNGTSAVKMEGICI